MNSIDFSLRLKPTNNHPITPDEQSRRLNSPYKADLNLIFPAALASIVDEYADCNLGPNGTRWFTALSNLKLLPTSIPPLPSNIHEILTASCPINTNQRVNESHSLWLVPAGNIDLLAERFYNAPENPLTPCLNKLLRRGVSDAFAKHTWILITELLPESTAKTHKEQIEMIEKLRDKAFLSYEVPNFKYALAANILKITAECSRDGLWLTPLKKRGRTCVQETFLLQSKNDPYKVRRRILSVGSSRQSPEVTVTPAIKEDDCKTRSTSTGVAALYRFPEPQHSSCVLS